MMIRDISYVGEGQIPAPLPADASVEWEIRFLQGIDEWHRSSRGLDGIGYQLCAMASRRVYIVSRLDRYGAGVGYENNHLLHLALPGDYSSQLPAPRHLVAAVEAVRYAYAYLGRGVPTTPHLYWGGTTCPGARWREWVPQLHDAATEEDNMTPEQFKTITDLLRKIIDRDTNQAVALRQYIEAAARVTRELSKKQIEYGLKAVLDAINPVPAGSGSLTATQVRQAVKDALREGTER